MENLCKKKTAYRPRTGPQKKASEKNEVMTLWRGTIHIMTMIWIWPGHMNVARYTSFLWLYGPDFPLN